ncbi:MAG TPA: right-handed parallel beta-helix repeat-containing protein [Vicinamibacterales bacterium]|jgi:hypothetical protein
MTTKVFRTGDFLGIRRAAARQILAAAIAALGSIVAITAQPRGDRTIYVDTRIRQATCTTYAPASRQCAGGQDTAFGSLAAASAAAHAGTRVAIREGVYTEPLVPAASGTVDQPITFENYEKETVVITGITDAPALQIIGRQFIVVRGLTISDVVGWGRLQDSMWNIVERMTFRNATASGTTGGLKLVRSSRNRVIGNSFDDGTDEVLLQDNSDGNLVADNAFSSAHHSLVSIRCSNANLIRRNRFDNARQKAIEIFDCEGVSDAPVRLDATKLNLIENNLFVRTKPTDRNYKYNAIQHGGQATIVRRNVFRNTGGGAVNYQQYERESLYVYGNRLYHNTFYDNRCFAVSGTEEPDSKRYYDNRVMNNLLYKNRDCAGAGAQTSVPDGRAVILASNAVEKNDPGFVNEAAGDLHLAAGSPMIDRASGLTRIPAAGSGLTMSVGDPLPFFDGYKIPGESGDQVQIIGSTETARVVRIDYKARTLTLDRELTWKAGDLLALAYSGAAPDFGAFEFVPRVSAILPTVRPTPAAH